MFDSKKFMQEKFKHRTKEVPVPDLKNWFEGKAVWIVRGLTGKEIGQTKESAAKNKSITGIIEMLKSTKVTDQTDALKAVFDLGLESTPENVAERLDQLVMGSIEPECNLELALKICDRFPVDFYNITNEILRLTGQGQEPGKRKGSGKKPMSEPV